jgi:prolyl oligopeptidase PreP (S9A serine peptidase family)
VQHSQVAKSVITPTDEDTKEVTQMLEQQLQTVLNPESQVDQTIPLPENEESLEEYEEIRQLWVEQYRKGEVPLSEDVHTRLEWVEQDVNVITDILTKLISKDENERQQALDEVGFILPVFLMNNLSGLQLITYLKAKVSAAKEVRVELKAKQAESLDEENLEEVSRQTGPAEENTKHLEVDEAGESRTVES